MKSTPNEQELESAHNTIARAYLQAVLELLWLADHQELNFIKKSIETPDGGVYILQLQHVTGPKINVQELFTKKFGFDKTTSGVVTTSCGCAKPGEGAAFDCGTKVSDHGNPGCCCECECHFKKIVSESSS